jgi:hypothetical protein
MEEPNSVKKKSTLSQVAFVLGITIAFGFIGNVIHKNWQNILKIDLEFDPLYAIGTIFFFSAAYYTAFYAWNIILQTIGITASIRAAQYNWFVSNLWKYVPGKVWTISSRAILHKKQNHPVEMIVSAIFLEALFSYSISVFVVIGLMVYLNDMGNYFLPLIGILIIFCFALSPRIFTKAINFALKIIKRDPINIQLAPGSRIKISLIYIIFISIQGVGFWIYIKSLFPELTPNYFATLFALTFSNLIGMLAFFVPKGVGVRESFIVLLLSPIISEPKAIIVSLSLRLWLIAIELIVASFHYFLLKPKPED